MKHFWITSAIAIIVSGCSGAFPANPKNRAVDQAALRSLVQEQFAKYRACVTFPRELDFRRFPRNVRGFVEVRRNRTKGDSAQLLAPFVQAGLVEIAEHPEEGRGKHFLFVKFTKRGNASLVQNCRNPDRSYGSRPAIAGFQAFDVEFDEFVSVSKPNKTSCVWHVYTQSKMRAVNIPAWYGNDLKEHLNLSADPIGNDGFFAWSSSFHSVGGTVWRRGSFDFIHSNLTCLEIQ